MLRKLTAFGAFCVATACVAAGRLWSLNKLSWIRIKGNMARVTVEDCIERVSNRFELVLLAAHRARAISNGSEMTVEPDRDKNPVIALREVAEGTIPPDDLREGLIHSIQKNVEVDEPEAEAAPMLASDRRPQTLGRDDPMSENVAMDSMTEDQLLRGMENLTPVEPSSNGSSGPSRSR